MNDIDLPPDIADEVSAASDTALATFRKTGFAFAAGMDAGA